jgi:hypothetical protein
MLPGLVHQRIFRIIPPPRALLRTLLAAEMLAVLIGCAAIGAVAPAEPFSRPGNLPAAAKTVAIAIADVDNDGALDVVAGAVEPGAILVLFGNGAGGVSAPQAIPVEGDVRSLAVADVNADGLADIVFSVQRQSSGIRVLVNRGQRRWEPGKSPIDINR